MTKRTRSQSVTDQLRELVLQGAFNPGERLYEIPLAERMGVSRTPVRDALNTLKIEGLLDYETQRGYGVHEFSTNDIVVAYEARAALEGLACRLAAEKGLSKEDLAALERCVENGDDLLSSGQLLRENLGGYRQMNVDFHETILRASGARILPDLVRQTHNIPFASNRIMVWNDYHVIHRSHDDHHRILDAIARQQAKRAAALMEEHVYFAGQILKKHIDAKARIAEEPGERGQQDHN